MCGLRREKIKHFLCWYIFMEVASLPEMDQSRGMMAKAWLLKGLWPLPLITGLVCLDLCRILNSQKNRHIMLLVTTVYLIRMQHYAGFKKILKLLAVIQSG